MISFQVTSNPPDQTFTSFQKVSIEWALTELRWEEQWRSVCVDECQAQITGTMWKYFIYLLLTSMKVICISTWVTLSK